MSALGLGVLFVISFTLGIAWLVWVLDARMARGRLACQLPLPLDDLGYAYGQKLQSGLQPLMVLAGSMLVFFAAMGAVIVGKLATMQSGDAAAVFQAYPLLHSLWGLIMGLGPITCVAMAVPGTYCIKAGLGAHRRRC
ncbi:MAG: hypothetical protein R3355_03945 [Pseudomonas sp.]|uniref:hypothetical protein n=1 Tax=Pseudomonas sp. TaxID=306 RepID=UPI00299D62A9|nr:hypothetical protein [Pseudomonas sp.]MDX1722249.1 hypothetical protein [Pseudomonas sp.]